MPAESIKPQLLKGFRDFLPAQQILRQRIIGQLRTIFEKHGFAPLDTPALEYAQTLTGKYGEEERLLYRFQDHGGRDVGLRYDLTVPLARVMGLYQNQIVFPFKRYHIAPVWRAENPQRGRYREFYQCDVDIVGAAGMLADAEILSILAEAMDTFGFTGYQILLYNRKLLEAMARDAGAPAQAVLIWRALDKLAKIGPSGVLAEMERYGVPADAARRALDFATAGPAGDNLAMLASLERRLAGDPQALEGVRELREIVEYLGVLTPSADRIRVDPTLARGLDYYTGPVWEINVEEPKIGSLGGGGRYDKLVGMFSGRDLPTTGSSIGLERIIDVMESLGLVQATGGVSQVLVAPITPAVLPAALALLAEIRRAGIPAEIYLTPGDKLGKQLQYADRLGIPLAVIVGPDELARDEVVVKDLRTQAQQTRPRAGLAPALLAQL
ncbi:MAG TPA: histidine--tRNA ligase [Chloroflexia bacterium]|nr:histidine--tRNA ligase [Chloroflexia bacterium]